jgi:hypothetical protein
MLPSWHNLQHVLYLSCLYAHTPPQDSPCHLHQLHEVIILAYLLLPLLLLLLQGDYDVQVVARGVDNEELMCVVVHFEM